MACQQLGLAKFGFKSINTDENKNSVCKDGKMESLQVKL